MVVQMLGDPQEVAREEVILEALDIWKEQNKKEIFSVIMMSCLDKRDREFSKLFYISIVRFKPPPNQNKQNQNAPLNLDVR